MDEFALKWTSKILICRSLSIALQAHFKPFLILGIQRQIITIIIIFSFSFSFSFLQYLTNSYIKLQGIIYSLHNIKAGLPNYIKNLISRRHLNHLPIIIEPIPFRGYSTFT